MSLSTDHLKWPLQHWKQHGRRHITPNSKSECGSARAQTPSQWGWRLLWPSHWMPPNLSCDTSLEWSRLVIAQAEMGALSHLPLCHTWKVFYDRMEKKLMSLLFHKSLLSHMKPQTLSPVHPQTLMFSEFNLNTAIVSPQLVLWVIHIYIPQSVLAAARQPTVSLPVHHAAPDGVLNYASAVLNDTTIWV